MSAELDELQGFDSFAVLALSDAERCANTMVGRGRSISSGHVLFGLLKVGPIAVALAHTHDLSVHRLSNVLFPVETPVVRGAGFAKRLTETAEQALLKATERAEVLRREDNEASTEDIFVGLLMEMDQDLQYLFDALGLDRDELLRAFAPELIVEN